VVQLYAFLGGDWSASCSGRFTPDTHCIGGWVGPIAGLDTAVAKNVVLLTSLITATVGGNGRGLF